MSNNTAAENYSAAALFVAYYPLSLIIIGTIGNFLTFIILCRPKFQDTNERPTILYMRVVAIFDILMLYGWNLDHYLWGTHGYTLRLYSIPTCKLFSFLNYFTTQSAAWLRVFICVDRYLAMSRRHRTWFGHSKSVLIMISSILSFAAIFNFHIVIFGCFYNPDGSINLNSSLYSIYPLWSQINLFVYNYIPFLFMVVLNSGVIYYLIKLRRTTTLQNSRVQHRAISITLLLTTCLFLLMTTPSNIGFAYFYSRTSDVILNSLDTLLYTYNHALTIVPYLVTLEEFRREFLRLICCKNNPARIEPTRTIPRNVTTIPLEANFRKSSTINQAPVEPKNTSDLP